LSAPSSYLRAIKDPSFKLIIESKLIIYAVLLVN
jgi:hypothetical protein